MNRSAPTPFRMGTKSMLATAASAITAALATALLLAAGPASAQITFYEHEAYEGRNFTTRDAVTNFNDFGFNDRASSVVVANDRWEVCQDAGYNGRCVVLRPGRYASLSALGLNDRVSSVRSVGRDSNVSDDRYAPGPATPYYDARRRDNERLFSANVTSVRAVMGADEQRCWVDREVVSQERGRASVPAGIAGALIGGILGHQVGGGTGRDIATLGGVVAGAAVGANAGRGNNDQTRDVKRCERVADSGQLQYWDVGYRFRGVDHHVQMSTRPGKTVTVNRSGEPRS